MPRHSNRNTPDRATSNRNLVLVTKVHIALDGGSEPLAAFQLRPPFGRSIFAVCERSSAPLKSSAKIRKSRQDKREWPALLYFVSSAKTVEGGRPPIYTRSPKV
ncbi:hypothetical protein MCOR16_011937 [Pyricularia oryzae]|nr:hypothetical protein MCOR16_011937 [Pyricularia oryzae]KAI6515256.1 hypothetical protein MCOR05_011859 [Pyricularia oryzae]